jgi:hypothetical protein
MRHEKTIGKPCAGNPHARFERGDQEPGLDRAPRLISTNGATHLDLAVVNVEVKKGLDEGREIVAGPWESLKDLQDGAAIRVARR